MATSEEKESNATGSYKFTPLESAACIALGTQLIERATIELTGSPIEDLCMTMFVEGWAASRRYHDYSDPKIEGIKRRITELIEARERALRSQSDGS